MLARVIEAMPNDASLQQIAVQLAAAFNAKDPAKLASLYTQTAILMPPNEGIVRGRAAIQAWFQPAMQRIRSIQIVPIRSSTLGKKGFQVGTFSVTAEGDTSLSPRRYKYALILKRVGEQWQIDCDIWNSDQPTL